MYECMEERYWQGKAEVLGEETFPVPLYLPQIPRGLLESNPVLLGETGDLLREVVLNHFLDFNPYPTAFPYGNGMVLHFYQQQESSTTKTVHKVINRGLKTYV